MAKINKSILDLIGNTPLLEAENIERAEGLEATVLLKGSYCKSNDRRCREHRRTEEGVYDH